jgi:hypothetical protein
VDGDEQQLVMGGRRRLRHLLVEQIGQAQVGAIGEAATLLTEMGVMKDLFGHPPHVKPLLV